MIAYSVLWGMLLVVIVTPVMALAYIPLGLTYARVQKQFVAASRELKRLDSVALSPIYSHFLETLAVREPGCDGSSAILYLCPQRYALIVHDVHSCLPLLLRDCPR